MRRRTPSLANARATSGIRATALSRSAGDATAGRSRLPEAAAGRAPFCAAASPARKPRRFASTALPSARIAASNAPAGIGSAPAPATTPSITALIMAPLSRAIASRSSSSAFREFFCDRFDQPLLIVAAVAHRHLLNHQIGAAGRGDRRGAVRRDKAARDGAAGFHQFARNNEIDIADARRQRQDRTSAAWSRPAAAVRCDRSWRRCAARRRGSTSIAPESPGSPPRATIQSVSTPPPSPPSAAIRMVMGAPLARPAAECDGGIGCDEALGLPTLRAASGTRFALKVRGEFASRRRPACHPITALRTRCSARSHQFGLLITSVR